MPTLTFIAEYCVQLLMHNTSHYTNNQYSLYALMACFANKATPIQFFSSMCHSFKPTESCKICLTSRTLWVHFTSAANNSLGGHKSNLLKILVCCFTEIAKHFAISKLTLWLHTHPCTLMYTHCACTYTLVHPWECILSNRHALMSYLLTLHV